MNSVAKLVLFLSSTLHLSSALSVGRPAVYAVDNDGTQILTNYFDSTPGITTTQMIRYTLTESRINRLESWNETSLTLREGNLETVMITINPDGEIVGTPDPRLGNPPLVSVTLTRGEDRDPDEYIIEVTLTAETVALSLEGMWSGTAKVRSPNPNDDDNEPPTSLLPASLAAYKGCTDTAEDGTPNFGLSVTFPEETGDSIGCRVVTKAGCSHGVYPVPAEVVASLSLGADPDLSSPPLQEWQLVAEAVNLTRNGEILEDGSYMYETPEVTYDISHSSPKDLSVSVEVQLLELAESVNYVYDLDLYTTYGCPDIVSFCKALSNDPEYTNKTDIPLLPSLPPDYFPSDMLCEYFAGSKGGAETDDYEELPEIESSECRPGEVRPKEEDYPLHVKFYCKDHCIMKWEDTEVYVSFDFKALSCHRGSSYWEEVQLTEKQDTMGYWPICDCGDGTLDGYVFDSSPPVKSVTFFTLLSSAIAMIFML